MLTPRQREQEREREFSCGPLKHRETQQQREREREPGNRRGALSSGCVQQRVCLRESGREGARLRGARESDEQ